MSTLDIKPDKATRTPETGPAPANTVERSVDPAAVITEQQVLFASAAALAPEPAQPGVSRRFAWSLRAMFARPERPRARKHFPQRFAYLENAAMSRAMDRL